MTTELMASSKPKVWEAAESFIIKTEQPTATMLKEIIPSTSAVYLTQFYEEFGIPMPPERQQQRSSNNSGPFRAYRSPLP